MSKALNILVTGCGGDIGQSICKILNELNHNTFGIDISDKNAAQFIFDSFDIGPKVSDNTYISDLENKCIDNHYYTLYTHRTNALSFLYLHTQIYSSILYKFEMLKSSEHEKL